MMYSEKFAVAVKSNGKVLREFGDKVYVPFGSEYSVYLKNMNSVRAEVDVSIDGKSVLGGGKLVVNANQSIDLERFLEDNTKGHKFKFIERTEGIEQHRGVEAEDGLVRVEFKYEVQRPTFYGGLVYPPGVRSIYDSGYTTSLIGGSLANASIDTNPLRSMSNASAHLSNMTYDSYSPASATVPKASNQVYDGVACMDYAPKSEVGITAKGDISTQKFQTVASFTTETQSHVIILQLLGETQAGAIKEPVTVATKQKCDLCGTVSKAKSKAKFCASCGNSLVIL